MKNVMLFSILLAGLFCGSCKKFIEEQQTNIIINAMTNGRWYVELYTDNSTDVTADFFGYEFQFYKDGKVDGLIGAATKGGTWNADISNYTITATFPASAGDTLKRLNYTWKIADSYLDFVKAKTTGATGENILHLRKK